MANYITLEDAETYLVSVKFEEDMAVWDEASTADKNRALKNATRDINALKYKGVVTDANQENAFPRDPDTEVPLAIQEACAEIAFEYVNGKRKEDQFEQLTVTSEKISSVAVSYDTKVKDKKKLAGIISLEAWRMLMPYLRMSMDVETV